ncbi:MAG: hypothetical protein Q8M77_20540 [Hydrogenophaga sp.]|nr:hypothetical protein [Hydrogenophaga sp.]
MNASYFAQYAKTPKLWLFIFSMIFAVVIHKTHAVYLYPEHAYLGFPYVPMGASEWSFILLSVFLVAWSLPANLGRPSGVISFMIYVIVFVPTLVITLATEEAAIRKYGINLSALTAGYLIVLHATKRWGHLPESELKGTTDQNHALLFATLLAISAGYLLCAFWDSINFVGLGGTYAQREAGRSRNLFEAYAQTYLAFVFAPALLSLGLIRKNPIYAAIALGGFFLMYSITAERTVFLLPVVMILAFLVLRSRISHSTWMLITLAAISMLFAFSIAFRSTSTFANLLSLYLVFRTFSVPGAMFWQYQEVFTEYGYTFWSHVRGISSFVSSPVALDGDDHWPQLGRIVAKHLLNLDINSNANLFAYDGVAGAGAWGILFMSVLLTLWLIALDKLSRGFEPLFPVLIAIPLGLVLINGPFFTAMMSFGGLFWLFFFFFSSRSHARQKIQ